jgi:hypothetical protein
VSRGLQQSCGRSNQAAMQILETIAPHHELPRTTACLQRLVTRASCQGNRVCNCRSCARESCAQKSVRKNCSSYSTVSVSKLRGASTERGANCNPLSRSGVVFGLTGLTSR